MTCAPLVWFRLSSCRDTPLPHQDVNHGTDFVVAPIVHFCGIPETTEICGRIQLMNRRDIIMVLAMLVLTMALTWAGTDYIIDHVVQPLMEDESAPSAGYPSR
jgi:hypothetical protein